MLILASKSPRRRQLLEMMNLSFTCEPADIVENIPDGTAPCEAVKMLAHQKAAAVYEKHPADTVLGSDTIVTIDGRILGKPKDEAEAAVMLRTLSGRKHKVYTGVSLMSPAGEDLFATETVVEFYPLSDKEIAEYIATGDPMDKAGAYGIQGPGCALVKGIDGDYFSVMGLPIAEVVRRLKNTDK